MRRQMCGHLQFRSKQTLFKVNNNTSKPTWRWDITANNRMKKILSLSLVLLMGIASMQAAHPEKLLKGKFQTASGEYVKFASGNLNYSGSSKDFGLLSSQLETRGSWNESTSSSWYGTWDLFGWATSKYNGLYPYETSESASTYASAVGADVNLGQSEFDEYDWGVHNTIAGSGSYYCMYADEWEYVLNGRPNAANLRALACVPYGGTQHKGLILLPDNWSTPFDLVINTKATEHSENTLTLAKWAILEACGAVFLPSGGRRYGSGEGSWTEVGSGFYWTGTSGNNTETAKGIILSNNPELNNWNRAYGGNVRLAEAYNYSCKTVRGEETVEDKTIEEYEWNGYKLTKSGNYTYTFLDIDDHGETDSIATLHLHMKDWTGIDNVPTTKQTKVQKVVRDGQLYIIRDDKMFNVAGQEVK